MSESFKLYTLSKEFYSICDWQSYKIPVKDDRPVLVLTIEDPDYPDCMRCIPISKDDDKNNKYKNLSQEKPDLVQHITINQYDNYLLIQNMFIVRKEYIGAPFLVNNVHSEIKKDVLKRTIIKKVGKVEALIKKGKLKYVPIKEVYNIQLEHIKRLNP